MTLSADSEQHWANLLRALRRSPGFSLHIVSVHHSVRDEVLRRLRKQLGPGSPTALSLLDPGGVGLTRFQQWLATRTPPATLHGLLITDGDALLSHDEGHLIAALNLTRDLLGEILGGPLVLVVSPLGAARLPGLAPDLFQVRTGTYRLRGKQTNRYFYQRIALIENLPAAGDPPSAKEIRTQRDLIRETFGQLNRAVHAPHRTIDLLINQHLGSIEILGRPQDHVRDERKLTDEIIAQSHRLLDLSAKLDYQRALALIHTTLTVVYRRRWQAQEAIKHAEAAIYHADCAGIKDLVFAAYMTLATTYLISKNDAHMAIISVQKALHLAAGRDDETMPRILFSAYTFQAASYLALGQPLLAMECIDRINEHPENAHSKTKALFALSSATALALNGRFEELSRFLAHSTRLLEGDFPPRAAELLRHEIQDSIESAIL